MKKLLWILVFILIGARAGSAQSVLYFPQIAAGMQDSTIGWVSVVALTNTAAIGSALASGTLTLRQSNGTPMNVPVFDEEERSVGSGNSVSFQIAGGQTKFYNLLTESLLQTGFATVTSNQPLAGAAVFVQLQPGRDVTVGLATVFAATPLTRQTIFVVRDDGDTGLAVANPGNATANVTFQLLNASGTAVVPSVTRTLSPNNHTALFVRELFPNAPEELRFGSLRITSDTPVVSVGLVFDESGQFTTLPVFPLQ